MTKFKKLPVKLFAYSTECDDLQIWDSIENATKGKSDENYDKGLLFISENHSTSFKLPQDVIMEISIKPSDKKLTKCDCGNGFVCK